jgi:hypothetical protein
MPKPRSHPPLPTSHAFDNRIRGTDAKCKELADGFARANLHGFPLVQIANVRGWAPQHQHRLLFVLGNDDVTVADVPLMHMAIAAPDCYHGQTRHPRIGDSC